MTQFKVRTDLRAGQGGWVGDVWYPDKSGVCEGGSTPPPTTLPIENGGGWVGGIWYPDQSGTC